MLQNQVISPPKVTIGHEYIEQIRDQKKIVEARLYKGLFRNLQPGHRIEFVASNNPHNFVFCKVRYTKRYHNFREMLQALEKAVSIYNGIPEHSRQVTIYGDLAIGIEVIR
ncbi:MAG: hypothetical protein ACRCSV_04120 [Chlamydiales bacterium]